jgi:hypothetical protein
MCNVSKLYRREEIMLYSFSEKDGWVKSNGYVYKGEQGLKLLGFQMMSNLGPSNEIACRFAEIMAKGDKGIYYDWVETYLDGVEY